MTFDEYKQTIDRWHELALRSSLTMSNGRPLPLAFWKTFLGIKRRVHQDLYAGKHKVRSGLVMPYLARSIHFVDLLSEEAMIDEIRACIPEFEANKSE